MSYLSKIEELKAAGVQPDDDSEWTVDVDGKQYYIPDGDNAVEQIIDPITGKKTTKSIRIGGINAPEIEKGVAFEDGKASKYKYGEIGGDHARRVLRDTLRSGSYSLGDIKEQEYGGGAGKRFVGSFYDKDNGETVQSKIFREGLAHTTFETTRAQKDAEAAGALNREMYGIPDNDPFQKLRETKPVAPPIFKTLANEKSVFQDDEITKKTGDREWYATSFADQIYKGASFDPKDTDSKGYTLNPISNGFKIGLHDTAANIGAFVSAIGTLAGPVPGSEWLKDYGDQVADVNQFRSENHPAAKIARLADVDKYSDGAGETIYNFGKWIATTAATSAPHIAAVLTGAAAAPLVLPAGAGAAATIAAGSVPTSILLAGSTWNGVDRFATDENGEYIKDENGNFTSNRSPGTAAISITAGIGAAVIERFGLAGALNPTTLMTKVGFNTAAKALATKLNVPLKAATEKLNTALLKETQNAYSYIGKELTRKAISSAALQQGLPKFINGAAKLGTAGAIEGATEVLQEATTYLTASAINAQPADPEEFMQFLNDKVKDNPELRTLALESFVAGGTIGSGINVAKASWDKSGELRDRAWKSQANPLRDLGTFREASVKIRDAIGESVSSIQKDLQRRVNLNLNAEFGNETDTYNAGAFAKHLADGQKSNAITRVASGESTKRKEIIQGITSLVFTPVGNLLDTAKIKAAPSLFKIASFTGGLRDALPGRNKDFQTEYLNGSLQGVFNTEKIGARHGFNQSSERGQLDFSKKFYKFGRLYLDKKKNLDNLTEADYQDLALAGIRATKNKPIGEVLLDYKQTYDDAVNFANELYHIKLDAYVNNLPTNDPRIAKAEAYKDDWAILTREVDVEAINADFEGAIEQVVNRITTIQNKSTSNEIENNPMFADKREYATKVVTAMRDGDYVDGEFIAKEGRKTTNVGKKATSLHLADPTKFDDGVDFSKYYTENVFSTYKSARERAVREAVDLDYNGENNSKLDVLFSDARNELLANTEMTTEQVDGFLAQLAKRIQDVDDARYGEYNRISPTLAAIQDNILSYTAVVGLPLGALASLAEGPGIAIGLRGSKEFKTFMRTVGKQFGLALVRGAQNAKATRVLPGLATVNKRIENEFFALQLITGLPQETDTLITRASGIENANAALFTRFKRRVLDAFFTATLLKGLTGVQRTIATATALDFIRNRVKVLIHISDFKNLKEPMTKEQLDAYAGLGQIGIDVPRLINEFQSLLGIGNKRDTTALVDGLVSATTNKKHSERSQLEDEILTGIQSFVNTRVQAPNASNRPLIVQDPHFKLLTQFNAFLSSVTTTMVPKIWNDEVGRGIRNKNPTLSYNAFAVIASMVAVSGASQWLKDHLKYGESTPHLDDDVLYIQRMITSSGILGQGEKIVDILHPLYPTRGEGIGSRALGTLLGAGGRQANSVTELFNSYESDDDTKVKEEFYKKLVKLLPGIAPFSVKREQFAGYLANTL